MSLDEQAIIILNRLDRIIQIDWNRKDSYVKAIYDGLREIQEVEKSLLKE